ncbi:unnamed protein product [Vitrella brassicaformis CCMP3155]|uniref:MORN repeat-containing protein 5 n=1 Tax=Vitrella brassicaformis (strain CCMP3155) TaxID=1169540 RepID=A0A0G4G5D7_VITBC|nr:unnamed protein product [Vitrella brassicaformis CCMP3155]|eukprot:CEM23450.1 unnamed protein product [Vitrella brassicaformis CCMP3155]
MKVYEGDWRDGKYHGKGVEYGLRRYGEGEVYIGDFADDKRHGEGEECDTQGRVFKGMWSHGKRHGRGEEFDRNGHVTYKGVWVDGQKKGPGEATGMEWDASFYYSLGYHGPTLDGKPHGQGELRFCGGDVMYTGGWEGGKRHGQGKAFWNGWTPVMWFDGEWRNDKVHSGTLFPDGDWFGAKNADGTPKNPIAPIPWHAGQKIPDIEVTGSMSTVLDLLLEDEGVSRHIPSDALS